MITIRTVLALWLGGDRQTKERPRTSNPSNAGSGVAAARLTLLVLLAGLFPALAQADTIPVRAKPIERFQFGSEAARFGPLEFVGGLELSAPVAGFGSFSAFRFTKPGSDFVGVTDNGSWFFGTVTRDTNQRPVGFTDFSMTKMIGRDGQPLAGKLAADAESLAIRGDVAAVGYERQHRVEEYRLDPSDMAGPLRSRDFLIPRWELRQNRGIETLAFAPEGGPLRGALVAVSERSLDKAGNVFAAVLDGPRKGIFAIRRDGEFDITDGAFLPGGDLLLLERSYSMLSGVKMRLRRIDAGTIRPGGVADGPALFTADMGYQIDNMEGMDVWRRSDGALVVSLISDDNGSILQRNLYLEFLLREE